MHRGIRINIGCSDSPTKGWHNFDYSIALKLSRHFWVIKILHKIKLITKRQYRIALFYKRNKVYYANAYKKIPYKDNEVDVIYSSHMIEHLTQENAKKFLLEAYRVLRKDGIIRLAVPDLKKKAIEYIRNGDANEFIYQTHMWYPEPESLLQKIYIFLTGPKHHLWMYDSKSLSKLLFECKFQNIVSLKPSETNITNPGSLDLSERAWDSFYLEAIK